MTKSIEYPENWKKLRYEEIAKITGGSTPDTNNDEYWGGNIKWVVPSEVTDRTTVELEDTERKITKEGLASASTTILPENSVMMTSRATVGVPVINSEPMATNQGFQSFDLSKNDEVTPYYLYYHILYNSNYINSVASGGTFDEISNSELSKLKLPVPPRDEQKRIASVLYSVDERITTLCDRKEWLEKHKQGVMQDAITGETPVTSEMEVKKEILDDNNSPAAVDTSLKSTKTELSEIVSLKRETVASQDQNGMNHVGLEHIEQFSTDHSYESADNVKSNKYKFSKGDILFGQIRSYLQKVCIAKIDGICSTDIFVIEPDGVNSYYLWGLLSSSEVNRWSQRASTGTKMPRVQWEPFVKKKIELPPRWEQERIASLLYIINKMSVTTDHLIDEHKKVKKGLMKELLSGEIRTTKELEVLDKVGV